MCGIAGWINVTGDISDKQNIIRKMTNTLSKRGPDDSGYYYSKNALLGHRRLIVVDPAGGAQPMIKTINNNLYVIVYNGELYNTEELRKTLTEAGFSFNSYSDTEVLLTSYIYWGRDCVNYINGIYAFAVWNEKEKSLFLARDPLGVKPLFYTIKNGSLIFGSEIKAILAHPDVEPIVDSEGLTELFALGPGRTLGSGVFKDIFEIAPAHYMFYTKDKNQLVEYWKPRCLKHEENIDETCDHVKTLLIDCIKRQLGADVPVCTFLSGGLDSSAISAVAAEEFKKQGKILNTFSIDYEDNNLYFKANDFQPTSDSDFALKMKDFIGSSHRNVLLNSYNLKNALFDAVKANDLPGMADVDSSLFLFCKEVKKHATVAVSGECADEIFGGYPWYRKEEFINANTFPWSISLNERKTILSDSLKKLDIEDYAKTQYENTLLQVPHMDNETKYEYRMRELFYLNIKWFMITLLNRKDRMSMSNSLEVRVPFADYRLVEYAFNIPSEFKFCDNREKGILRRALKGILPDEIVERKKSPYPKTHNPSYTRLVQEEMNNILNNKKSPILPLIDFNQVQTLVETGGKSYTKPWFGQLMTGPQLLAYLIQINYWLKEYNVQIKL